MNSSFAIFQKYVIRSKTSKYFVTNVVQSRPTIVLWKSDANKPSNKKGKFSKSKLENVCNSNMVGSSFGNIYNYSGDS